ncbi:MAG: LacI family transcriptional regulator [Micromonosporaceae bacterium]|jgi:LacI family transcriptional regulator|nr:LacI family transcriptional regulator [Micromonosporaceae bacterium]
MHDVAARAGVSIATVSRALNGNRPMSAELRDQVLAAADALEYRVNLLGRALRLRRTFSLGLVVPDLENPYFSALGQQVSRSFSRSNIDVFIYSADNDIKLERRAIQSFLGRQVDGLVLIPSDEVDSAENVLLADNSVVTIQFDRRVRSQRTRYVRYVGCDNRHGMRLVVEHLNRDVDLERQPPIFVGARPTSSSAHERLEAFTKAVPTAKRLLGSFSFEWGQQAAYDLIDRGVTAGTIVTAADVIALGVIAGVQTRGYLVPENFRVIGFDDIGVSFLAHPALTSVRQPVDEMTTAIVEMVLGKMAGDASAPGSTTKVFKPALMIRESSPGRLPLPRSGR